MQRRRDDLRVLERRLGHRFSDRELLISALTHASAIETPGARAAERLEFLGDAVVGLALSDLLSERYASENEGQLSKFRAALVNTASFANKARELGIDAHLRLGRGEEKGGGREKTSILAATYEAVMGAVFRDGGYDVAHRLVAAHFEDQIAGVCDLESPDPKTELQEVCQAICRLTPIYRVVKSEGPDHARRYVVEVVVGAVALASGEGSSKRSAEHDAALRALRSSRDLILSLAPTEEDERL